jgi:hypothetical protein
MSKVGIKKYIGFSFVISAGLSVVKAFIYEINLYQADVNYPMLFNLNSERPNWRYETKYQLVLIFNSVYDIVNYVLFTFINLLVDILLLVKLRQALKEREEKFKEQSEAKREKLKKDNKESFRKVVKMVILYSLINLVLKLPILITSLNDLRLLSRLEYYYNYKFIFKTKNAYKPA